MMQETLSRYSRLAFRNGKNLRNRVVVPPMASGTATEEGFVTEATLAHYAKLAKSGAGLVMVEYTFVDLGGRRNIKKLGIHLDEQVGGLARLVSVIHQAGAKAGLQLTHAGGKTRRSMTGGVLWAPGTTAVPVKDQQMEFPDAMGLDEIAHWKGAFERAVDRAVRAGFDAVEFHAAHGYGLNQWISPLTNSRTDEYGGSFEKRVKLLEEIVQSARRAHPDLLLAVRLPGRDFLEGGLTSADSIRIARRLERIGLDFLDISSGLGGWRRPERREGEGYLVEEAATLQACVSIPVIGVGGIETGAYIDEGIRSGKVALMAVGRAILADPVAWGVRELGTLT